MRAMRLLGVAAALSVALLAAGCNTTSSGGVPVASSIVDQVQAYTEQACGILPAFESVAAIVATFTGASPFVSVASQVGEAICTAVDRVSAVRGKRPAVNGVEVKFKRVRR